MNIITDKKKPPFFIGSINWLLNTARKVRWVGFTFFILALLINYYFIMFDQQNYVRFLEYFSSDGSITDVNAVFIRIQTLIVYLIILWVLTINQLLINLSLESSIISNQPAFSWRHGKFPYIISCIIWMLVSYLPFFFLDSETVKYLAKEDSFYEYAGFIFLLFTSISFFYLFYKERTVCNLPSDKARRNIFFLLLGLLFFFGAGEEISWGQRVFHFHTPEILSQNIQHEFNLHNLPLFDVKVELHKMKTGFVATHFNIEYLFKVFCIFFGVIIPFLYLSSSPIHKFIDKTNLPVPPIWIGIFFLLNNFFYWEILVHISRFNIYEWPFVETYESVPPFIFLVMAIWFINNYKARNKQ